MMPREKIAQFSSAPPLNKFSSAARLPPVFSVSAVRNHSCRTAALTPGVVIAAPNRTTTTIASVNRIRRRSSGILSVLTKAETISGNYFFEVFFFAFAAVVDLFFGFDFQRVFQFAIAQNFDPGNVAAHEIRFAEQLFINNRSRFEFIEIAQVHDREIFVEGRVVEAALRQTPNERHLAAFKSETNAAARARLLAFVTFAARLSVTGTFAATKSLYAMTGAGTRSEIM